MNRRQPVDKATRLTLRIPSALKRQIDERAGNNRLSVNAWIRRCLERAADKGASA